MDDLSMAGASAFSHAVSFARVALVVGALGCSGAATPTENTREPATSEPRAAPVKTSPDEATTMRESAASSPESVGTPPVREGDGIVAEVGVVPVFTMRTARGSIHVRVRVDNPTSDAVRVRTGSVRALSPPVGRTAVEAVDAQPLPLGEQQGGGESTQPAVTDWIVVPASQSVILTLFLDHRAPEWTGRGTHRYRVELAREGGEALVSDAESVDAIRHPIRR